MALGKYNWRTQQWEKNQHVMTVDEAAELISIHPDTIRAAVKRGEKIGFPVIKAGRRYVVPKRPLHRILGIEEGK